MRVLIVDRPGDPDIERAALPTVEVQALPRSLGHLPSDEELLHSVRERATPVLITFYGLTFEAGLIGGLAAAGVRGIVCASVGYDKVDISAARSVGITICNVPDYGTEEVADHTLALLLWCLRGLGAASPAAVATGSWWDPGRFAGVRRIQEATLALLGFGRIGQAVARRAQGLGMAVRWYDPYVPRGQDKVTRSSRVESVRDLLTGADALSIHCHLSGETRGLIGAAALALLPPHAVLVNTARGPVIDEAAVLTALRHGRLAGAALDVLEREPPPMEGLYGAYQRGELPTLLLTPHTAWYSKQSLQEVRRKAAAEAARLLRGEPPFSPIA